MGPSERGGNGILFGDERLAASFGRACRTNDATSDAATVLERIRTDLFAHMAGVLLHDDLSLMVLRRR